MHLRLVLALLVLGMCLSGRGFFESFESGLHLALYGHSAHEAEAADGDAHSDLEHGCVGNRHVCPCCPAQPIAVPASVLAALASVEDFQLIEPVEQRAGPHGIRSVLFRPPIG